MGQALNVCPKEIYMLKKNKINTVRLENKKGDSHFKKFQSFMLLTVVSVDALVVYAVYFYF